MVVVYGIKERLDPIKARLSDVIHGCMQSVLGLPEDKRAHRFVPLAQDDFYYPGGRTDLRSGRLDGHARAGAACSGELVPL